jgi:hypothetical protein
LWSVEAIKHAYAALALYGQSFGFTRRDVEHVRAQVQAIRGVKLEAGKEYSREAELLREVFLSIADDLESLANRIEALLPEKE